MKKVYFVRHGESEGNIAQRAQTAVEPLTEKGIRQAGLIAKRMQNIPIDCVISSTMIRAHHTAEKIAEKIQKPIDFSELFVENRRPSEVIGLHWQDSVQLDIRAAEEVNKHIPHYRFSDEENFEDLYERGKKAIELLENRPEQNILVVTHGMFMRNIIGYAIFGNTLTRDVYEKLKRGLITDNTGITLLRYDTEQKQPWALWTWNDHAHLGDIK